MEYLDWKWASYGDKIEVPSITQIIRHAERQLYEVLNKGYSKDEGYSISCGGFKSTYHPIKDDNEPEVLGNLVLEFILEDWSEDVTMNDYEV